MRQQHFEHDEFVCFNSLACLFSAKRKKREQYTLINRFEFVFRSINYEKTRELMKDYELCFK